jgi:hypothetical protein
MAVEWFSLGIGSPYRLNANTKLTQVFEILCLPRCDHGVCMIGQAYNFTASLTSAAAWRDVTSLGCQGPWDSKSPSRCAVWPGRFSTARIEDQQPNLYI